MLFDDLLNLVDRRITTYRVSQQPEIVLSKSALVEATDLWRMAQPRHPDQPTFEEGRRRDAARHVVGWLYCARYFALPEGPDHIELARLVVFLQPFAHLTNAVPEPLRDVLGPTANADIQGAEGSRLLDDAMTTTDPLFLDAADILLTSALSRIDHENPRRATYLSNLTSTCLQRYQRHGRVENLERAVDLGEQAVAAFSSDDPNRLNGLANLGNGYWLRYKRTEDAVDLHRATSLGEQALAAASEDDPRLSAYLSNLSIIHQGRQERGDENVDFDRAIELGRRAIAASPDNHPDTQRFRTNLSAAYRARYRHTGMADDLEQAIDLAARSVAATPEGHPDRPGILFNLGGAYLERAEANNTETDVDRAIRFLGQAAVAIPAGHPQSVMVLSVLGRAHHARYDHTGALSDVDSAIQLARRALECSDDDHPGRAALLADLGVRYQMRFEHTGSLLDIDRATEQLGEAIAATPQNHPDRVAYLSDLSKCFWRRFDQSGIETDLEQAIDLGNQAVAAASDRHPAWAMMLTSLSAAYRKRFQLTGAMTDLDHTVDLAKRAIATTTDHDPTWLTCLSTLSNACLAAFDRGGAAADLDLAIDRGEQALAAERRARDPAVLSANLCAAYWKRFALGGVAADLDRAIDLGEAAVDATPDTNINKGSNLAHLGAAYHARYGRIQSATDLDLAIHSTKRAVDLTPQDHYTRPGYLSDLAGMYLLRHRRSRHRSDLDQAIDIGNQALVGNGASHPDRARYLSILSAAYYARFRQLDTAADLDHAVDLDEQALVATPLDHPHYAMLLHNIGISYRAQSETHGKTVGRQRLRALAEQVTNAIASSPVHRVHAATAIGSLAQAMNDDETAVTMFDSAVGLLPSVVPRETDWTDQEHRIAEHSGVVGDAVAAHCAINDAVGAVQVAELGRGILLAAQLDSRTDLTDLDGVEPELARAFRRVRAQLNTTDARVTVTPNNDAHQVNHLRRLWAEHDELLAQIRHHPRFTQFLRPPHLDDLRPVAAGGAVVLVNAGRRGGNAIITTADRDPILIDLPHLTETAVFAHTIDLLDCTQHLAGSQRKHQVLPQILGWLWDTAAQPVLDALPPSPEPGSTLPRVWWMPLGLLGLFPLHAAGYAGQPGALDRVVSSYTATLRTLAHARNRPATRARRQLVVALKHTPGLPDLPGTVAEATDLHARHPDIPPLIDHRATAAAVLAALPTSTWVHFACHASIDAAAPSQGGLHLHDRILAFSEISQLRLDDAELAYLSACSTAHQGTRHADESLHLASAFQLAGFRHVIATLWPLNDRVAATAARRCYDQMPPTNSGDHAATVLHRVTHTLRNDYPDRPGLWAPFIHTGP